MEPAKRQVTSGPLDGGTGEGVGLRPECGLAIGKEERDIFAVMGFAGEAEFIIRSHSKGRPLGMSLRVERGNPGRLLSSVRCPLSTNFLFDKKDH